MSTTELTIKQKIAAHQANKPVGFTRGEEVGSRDSIRAKASKHEEVAIKALAKLAAGGRKVPATAQKAAAAELLDRIGGKPKLVDEKQTELSELDKMNPAELMEYITQQISSLDLPKRVIIRRSVDEGLAFDAADIAEVMEEVAAREPKPRKVPRR